MTLTMVAFAGVVAGALWIGGGEFAGFLWLALIAALAVFTVAMTIAILVIDLAIAAARDGQVPSGALAFASAAGAALVFLLAIRIAPESSMITFGAIFLASPLVWRLLASRQRLAS